MKLYDFLMFSRNTAKISGTDSNITVIFEETVNNCEISVEAFGWIERIEKGRSSDPTKLENDDVQFFCTSVVVMVDGFDNIDEIDMPEFPETVVQDFVNDWFVDDMQNVN